MSIKINQKIRDVVIPILKNIDLELYDIEYIKEDKNWFLRVYINKVNGEVDIDDCGRASEALSIELDKIDPIPNAYFLEVSSPGAERELRNEQEILNSINRNIMITTNEKINNKMVFEGVIEKFENNIITITSGKTKVDIPYDKVVNIRLAVVF